METDAFAIADCMGCAAQRVSAGDPANLVALFDGFSKWETPKKVDLSPINGFYWTI